MELWIIAISVAAGLMAVATILVVLALCWDLHQWDDKLNVIHDDWIICPSCGGDRIAPYKTMCVRCKDDLNKGDQ